MKQFRIYEQPTGIREAVKIGWSWPGFFFTWIWALVKKLWGIGFGVLAAVIVLMIVQVIVAMAMFDNRNGLLQGTMPLLDLLVQTNSILLLVQYIGLPILFGIKGNSWRGSKLLDRGFELKQTVSASNAEGAISIYLKNAHYVQGVDVPFGAPLSLSKGHIE